MRIRRSTVPAALVSAALLLTACGSDSPLEGKSAQEVSELAFEALEEAGSVRISGTVVEDGDEGEIDMLLQGDDAQGSISVLGTTIELINVGGVVYVKATPDLLASFGLSGADAAEYEDQWLELSEEDSADFAEFTLDDFLSEGVGDGNFTDEVRKDEVDGDAVVIIEEEDGGTLTVKDDDPAYPLEFADDESTLTFSDHGKKQDISAPEDAISFEELMGG